MFMWQVWLIIGILFLIFEIFTPATFFLNLSISALIVAGLALFVTNLSAQIIIFVALSVIALLLLRPIFMNMKTEKSQQTGIQDKYIGKTVKVIETITKSSGVITIYGERWEARTDSDEEIAIGSEVKIIRNESLIMYVEKI